MTTIAYRDGVMAADSLATIGGTKVHGNYKKIHRIADFLVGCSGGVADCERFIQWLQADEDEEHPPKGEYGAIVVNKQKRILEIENGSYMPRPRGQKFVAIGSGSPYAIAAMLAGASAIEAVKIAAKVDTSTGLPVISLKL